MAAFSGQHAVYNVGLGGSLSSPMRQNDRERIIMEVPQVADPISPTNGERFEGPRFRNRRWLDFDGLRLSECFRSAARRGERL